MNILRLPPPDWWRPGLTEEGERWFAAHSAGELPDPWEAAGFKPAKATVDRVVVDDAGRIIILAGRHEWFSRRRPRPFIVGEQHTLYEIAMALGDRHPYSVLYSCGVGTGVEDESCGDLRRATIARSDKSQKIYDTIIKAERERRIKRVPTSWGKSADDTRWVFSVAAAIEIILHDLADDLAALGDGSVIGARRAQRDVAKAERERQAADGEPEASEPERESQAGGKTVGTVTAGGELPEDSRATKVVGGAATRRRGRNPGDGTKDDENALSRMFDLIKSDQASSPTAAGQLVASEDSEPAQYAYRRLASKFITKYGLYRLEREPWGEVCRRIASEMQTK